MYSKTKLVLIFIFFCSINTFSQINYFNFYRPYQVTLCCPVNVYGLGIEANYFLVNNDTAKLEFPVSLYWGLVDSIELGFKVSAATINSKNSTDKGITDILLGVKYNFISPAKKKMYETESKFNFDSMPNISSEFGLTLPTGDFVKGFGTGGIGFVINWLLEKEIVLRRGNSFYSFLSIGYKINTVNSDEYLYGNELFYSLGSYFDLKKGLVEKSFILSCGLKGISHGSSKYKGEKVLNSEYVESYIFGGLSYDLDVYQQFFLSISLGIDEKSKVIIFNVGMNY